MFHFKCLVLAIEDERDGKLEVQRVSYSILEQGKSQTSNEFKSFVRIAESIEVRYL